jgi:predicted MPP superfamily phosphohydrolase
MTFFIIVFLVYAQINVYLFLKGWKALPHAFFAKTAYGILFFIFSGAFIFVMLGRNFLPLEQQKPLYFIGTSWLAVMLYVTLYFFITDFTHGMIRLFHRRYRTVSPALFRRIQVISAYAIVGIILLFGYHKFTHPSLVEKEIIISKSGGKYKELKVVAFSDMHLGVAIDKKKLQKYVQFINDQQPDIIFMAGDMIDNNVLPLREEKMQEEINRLQAPLGVYFCLGNHEYLSGIEASMEFLRKTNMVLLIDSAVQIDDSFWIIGRDDKEIGHRRSLKELVAQTNPSQPLFLLDHQPYLPEDAVKNGIDLQFSGHTHDGQLWPLNLIVRKIYEISHGYKSIGNTQIYVSSGLGLWGPPYRVGTQSELVVFNIKFKS